MYGQANPTLREQRGHSNLLQLGGCPECSDIINDGSPVVVDPRGVSVHFRCAQEVYMRHPELPPGFFRPWPWTVAEVA